MNSPRLEISPSLTVSTPALTWWSTTSATASGSAWVKASWPAGPWSNSCCRPAGRGSAPACDTRIRSVLRFIAGCFAPYGDLSFTGSFLGQDRPGGLAVHGGPGELQVRGQPVGPDRERQFGRGQLVQPGPLVRAQGHVQRGQVVLQLADPAGADHGRG